MKMIFLGFIIAGFFGYLGGWVIKYLNVFGTSDSAPISCLIGALGGYLVLFFFNKIKYGK